MEPINFSLIFSYGVQMTLTFLICLGIYTVKVQVSKTDTADWYATNALRLSIGFVLLWLISAGLVIVPNIAMVLGAFGFNADQSAAGIALVIVAFFFKPGAATEEEID
jgi:3-hydroxy-3-methylglutaryl CoA synthase